MPEGFDANMALGDALAATGNQAEAKAAYGVALRRGGDEPTAGVLEADLIRSWRSWFQASAALRGCGVLCCRPASGGLL